jgi:Rrf2 family transcriptional regulator, cysteine metabolism repressor
MRHATCDMRVSSKGEYGLRALFDLAQRYGAGPVQSHDIHERQGIDENYLNQILISLRKAGLIESVRGPQGGHRLARSPAQITLLEVVVALEGPLLPADAGREIGDAAEPIDLDIVRDVWSGAREALEQYLGNLTLEDLTQRKRRRVGEVMYYI